MNTRPVTATTLTRRQGRIAYWLSVFVLAAATSAAAAIWSSAFSTTRQFDQAIASCAAGECSDVGMTASTATVIDTGHSSGKNPRYWLDVSVVSGTSLRVRLADDSGVWSAVSPGDPVSLLFWHDLIVNVSNGDVTSSTWDDPDENALRDYVAMVGIAAVLLILMVWPAVRRLRRVYAARWLLAAWFAAVGLLSLVWSVNTTPTGYLVLPAAFAVMALVTYPTVFVVEWLLQRTVGLPSKDRSRSKDPGRSKNRSGRKRPARVP